MSASPLPAASPDAAPIPLSTKQTQEHRDLANAIRALAMDAVEQAKSSIASTASDSPCSPGSAS